MQCNVFIIWSLVMTSHAKFIHFKSHNRPKRYKRSSKLDLLYRVFIVINVINVLISYTFWNVSVLTTKSVRTFVPFMTFMTLSYDFYDVKDACEYQPLGAEYTWGGLLRPHTQFFQFFEFKEFWITIFVMQTKETDMLWNV